MSGVHDDLRDVELGGGQGPVGAEMKRKAGTGENGDEGDLRIMDHFVRDLIEGPDEA